MKAFDRGWWLPLHRKKPEHGFRWKQQRLTRDECELRYQSGQPLGLRPSSIEMVCVDVDREGGRQVLESLCLEVATSYRTSERHKGHFFFRYEGEPFAWRNWSYGQVFHNNYVWVRDPARIQEADERRECFGVLDVARLPGLGRVPRDEGGEGLRSIAPQFTEEQAAEGRRQAAFNRLIGSIGLSIEAQNLVEQGYTKAETGRRLGISRQHVYRLLGI